MIFVGYRIFKKLHTTIKRASHRRFDQNATNHALRIVGHVIRCGGAVTAEMDTALVSLGFDSSSYYDMLTGCGW